MDFAPSAEHLLDWSERFLENRPSRAAWPIPSYPFHQHPGQAQGQRATESHLNGQGNALLFCFSALFSLLFSTREATNKLPPTRRDIGSTTFIVLFRLFTSRSA